jgi:hypothetical protein
MYRFESMIEFCVIADLVPTHTSLAPLQVRGLTKVQLHADLVMLARLGQALSRVREVVPLAA